MKKVYFKCEKTCSPWWVVGKEYEVVDGFLVDEECEKRDVRILLSFLTSFPNGDTQFTRIERETFEARGHQWFRHTPGDPMPADGDSTVHFLLKGNLSFGIAEKAIKLDWTAKFKYGCIIGWRYADESKAEPVRGDAAIAAAVRSGDFSRYSDSKPAQEFKMPPNCSSIEDVATELFGDMSAANDLAPAAIEDSSLSPSQRKHWADMEAKQAAKEQLQKDAEDKALQERAKELSDAGSAMDKVKQDHGHKFGCNYATY